MAIYSVSDITVKDPEAFAVYVKRAVPIIEKYGGRCLVLGGKVTPGKCPNTRQSCGLR